MGVFSWLFGRSDKKSEIELSVDNPEVVTDKSESFKHDEIKIPEPIFSNCSDPIIFQPDKINQEELNKCKVGDYVNLWAPTNEPTAIYIFRRGSIGGDGKIGRVPSNYALTISNHLREGLEYETEFLELYPAKIKYRVIPKEESAAKRSMLKKEENERITFELNKKYNPRPKTTFEIKIRLPLNHNQSIGDILFLEKKPKDYYIQNPTPLCINFIDKQGAIIVKKDSEPTLILKILKAYFNNYSVSIKILTIYKPDKYTSSYLIDIDATALVNFESIS
jgi:hypothetical protein